MGLGLGLEGIGSKKQRYSHLVALFCREGLGKAVGGLGTMTRFEGRESLFSFLFFSFLFFFLSSQDLVMNML